MGTGGHELLAGGSCGRSDISVLGRDPPSDNGPGWHHRAGLQVPRAASCLIPVVFHLFWLSRAGQCWHRSPSPSAEPLPLAPALSSPGALGSSASACYSTSTRQIHQEHRACPADGNKTPAPCSPCPARGWHSGCSALTPVPGVGAAATSTLCRSCRFPAMHAADLIQNENLVCFSPFFFPPIPAACGQWSVPSPRFVRAGTAADTRFQRPPCAGNANEAASTQRTAERVCPECRVINGLEESSELC